MKKSFLLSILFLFGYLYAGPLLIYNQYPRVWGMSFMKMIEYVSKIKDLGFNVVWVNPFFQSSETVVQRFNKFTGDELSVKGSLYAMRLDEFCRTKMQDSLENIAAYTSAVKDNGMIPIFDLVLNHAAKDSPLIKANPDWFQEPDDHWDDVCPFKYTEVNRDSIFKAIWQPLLDQMVELGFLGMRVDYGTDVDQPILKMCVDYLKKKIKNPLIVFGEALIPIGKDVCGVLASCKGTGFTHLTNLSIFLSKKQILNGKSPTSPCGYQWFLHDLGLKKSTCTGKDDGFWSGTIGFSGSHDHGTTILSYFLNQEVSQEDIDAETSKGTIQEDIEKQAKCVRGKLIQRRLSNTTPKRKLEIVKERMAIAAFSSDAGWYCFSSDEWMSEIVKSPFVRSNQTPFHEEEIIPDESNTKIESFIKSINSIFAKLKEAQEIFWVEIFYSEDSSHLIFVRHLSKNQLPADVVYVKIKEEEGDLGIEEIKGILSDKHAEINSFDAVKFYCLK